MPLTGEVKQREWKEYSEQEARRRRWLRRSKGKELSVCSVHDEPALRRKRRTQNCSGDHGERGGFPQTGCPGPCDKDKEPPGPTASRSLPHPMGEGRTHWRAWKFPSGKKATHCPQVQGLCLQSRAPKLWLRTLAAGRPVPTRNKGERPKPWSHPPGLGVSSPFPQVFK